MTRLEAWLLHAATILVTLTGLIYAWMHFLLKPIDPFAVVNHPLEPHMLSAHILIAPFLVLLIGVILHSHILFKYTAGARFGRRSGILLGLIFIVMTLSGYMLQVFTSSGHKALVIVHLSSGVVWAIGYLVHQILSIKTKQRMKNNRPKAVLTIAFLLLTYSMSRADSDGPLERSVYLMGTNFHMVLYETDRERALHDSEGIVHVVEDAEAQLSTWRANSEVTAINKQPAGVPQTLSPSLCELLRALQEWTEKTGGAFDPTVGSLAQAWDIHGSFRIPGESEIQDALKKTGMTRVLQIDANCRLKKSADALIDVGAFGKGEALDRSISFARQNSMGPLLLDFGGQIAISGFPPGKKGWEVTLSDPSDRTLKSPVQVLLTDGSLSTSGGSERDGSVNGRRISHHLDPRTGQPVESFGSVTVWQDKALTADVLSTALYVMGPKKGLEWASQNGIAACFLTNENGSIRARKTPEFVDKFK